MNESTEEMLAISHVSYVIDTFVGGCRVTVKPSPVASSLTTKQRSSTTTVTATNFTSQDFLGFSSNEKIRETSKKTLEEYSVGSCGPRGFYGTTLKHLDLESTIANFMGTPESITYSDATATISSVIPAFAKRGDIVILDEGVNYGIQLGARLSRSKIIYFRHNDMTDLLEKLQGVADSDKKNKNLSTEQRRFIVVEGVFANSGQVCPMQKVIHLANEYKWRVIVDDSIAFGVLGYGGRGSTINGPNEKLPVQVVVGSLGTSLGSVGGFCVGSRQVVDHQRLSGAGYCFSASAPPFSCAVATAAIKMMENNPKVLTTLQNRCKSLHTKLIENLSDKLVLLSHDVSPIKFLALAEQVKRSMVLSSNTTGNTNISSNGNSTSIAAVHFPTMRSPTTQEVPGKLNKELILSRQTEEKLLDRIIEKACWEGNVLITRNHILESEAFPHPPCLKLAITAEHTENDIDTLISALRKVMNNL